MPVAQVNNPQMKDILDSEFQRSSDPSFLHRIAVSKYLNLPGIRGFWGPAVRFSTQGALLYATDMTGGGYHMVWSESLPVFYSYLGYLAWGLDGATDYASYPDCLQFDVLASAAETWIGFKGLSLGAWIYPTRAQPHALYEGIISKFNGAGNQRAYSLHCDPTNATQNGLTMYLSQNGIATYQFDHTKTLTPGKWYFVAATFNPVAVLGEPAGVRLWVNDHMEYHAVSDQLTIGLPASIFNSNQSFEFGSISTVANFLGYQTNWFLAGNYLLEGEIYNIFESTKYLMGFANEFGTSW